MRLNRIAAVFYCIIKCRITEVKNPTEELTGIYFFTLVVGYFADAQYDVFFAFSFGVDSPAETGETSRQRQKGRVRRVGEVARSADRG